MYVWDCFIQSPATILYIQSRPIAARELLEAYTLRIHKHTAHTHAYIIKQTHCVIFVTHFKRRERMAKKKEINTHALKRLPKTIGFLGCCCCCCCHYCYLCTIGDGCWKSWPCIVSFHFFLILWGKTVGVWFSSIRKNIFHVMSTILDVHNRPVFYAEMLGFPPLWFGQLFFTVARNGTFSILICLFAIYRFQTFRFVVHIFPHELSSNFQHTSLMPIIYRILSLLLQLIRLFWWQSDLCIFWFAEYSGRNNLYDFVMCAPIALALCLCMHVYVVRSI